MAKPGLEANQSLKLAGPRDHSPVLWGPLLASAVCRTKPIVPGAWATKVMTVNMAEPCRARFDIDMMLGLMLGRAPPRLGFAESAHVVAWPRDARGRPFDRRAGGQGPR